MFAFLSLILPSAALLSLVIIFCGGKKDSNEKNKESPKPMKKADLLKEEATQKEDLEKEKNLTPSNEMKKDDKSKKSHTDPVNEEELDKTQRDSVKILKVGSKEAKPKTEKMPKTGEGESNMSELEKPPEPVEQDDGYENVPDMTPEELEKIAKGI